MTTIAAPEATPYLRALESLEQDGYGLHPQWLQSLRRDAMDAFMALGFPTARRGNEEWKYTDVRPIARAGFRIPTLHPDLDSNVAAHVDSLGDPSWNRLVFVDGRFMPQLSDYSELPEGVTVTNLAQRLESHGPPHSGASRPPRPLSQPRLHRSQHRLPPPRGLPPAAAGHLPEEPPSSDISHLRRGKPHPLPAPHPCRSRTRQQGDHRRNLRRRRRHSLPVQCSFGTRAGSQQFP